MGYGDIRAHTDLERAYATFVMIIGVVAYGYIIASVAASLANADSGRAQYQDKLKAVKSYLKVHGYMQIFTFVVYWLVMCTMCVVIITLCMTRMLTLSLSLSLCRIKTWIQL